MESILNFSKERRLAEIPYENNHPFTDRRGTGGVKFYVTIPIADVGVIVLEQMIVIDSDEGEVA